MSPRRLTYRDAVRLAPVAYVKGFTRVPFTIEGTDEIGWIRVRGIGSDLEGAAQRSAIRRPNAAARRLLEALR